MPREIFHLLCNPASTLEVVFWYQGNGILKQIVAGEKL